MITPKNDKSEEKTNLIKKLDDNQEEIKMQNVQIEKMQVINNYLTTAKNKRNNRFRNG